MVNNNICKFQIYIYIYIYLSGDSVFYYLLNIFYRHSSSCLASMEPGKDLMSLWLSGVLCYLLLSVVLISILQNSNGSAEKPEFCFLYEIFKTNMPVAHDVCEKSRNTESFCRLNWKRAKSSGGFPCCHCCLVAKSCPNLLISSRTLG